MAEIQDSKSIGSVSGANLAGDIMVNAGNSSTGPNAQPVKMSNAEMAQARINAAFSNAYVDDTARYNKLTSFNASHHGKNFERYYSHPKFKNLGFSPWRDNETYYNENSSVWDDALRGVKATGQLMGLAFTENLTNWGSLFSLKPNVEGADKMERIMSVGSSSRDSIGGKLINFGVNSGYTLGTVSEIIAEEVLLWGATAGLAATGIGLPAAGATGAAATVRTGYNIARLGKAFKGLSDAFRTAKKIETARDIFNGAKGLGKALDYITPFQNTRQLLTQAGRAGGKWDDLDKMAKVSKGFGSFYKDLVQINAVTSEAKLEGGFAQNDVVNRLYEDFRKENGRDPNEIEATSIYNQAREAGYLSSQMNAAGIYVSNKILLDRLFKRIPGMGQLDDVARRKIKGTPIYTGNWAKKDGAWEVVSGIKKFGKAGYYKQAFDPKNLAKGSLGYLSANLMEGTQEVYQEAIAKGITDYYVETYNQPSRVGNAEFYTKMKSGLQSQFSEQGLETFLSGFLMAGPVTAAQSAFYKGVDYARVAQLKIQDKQFKADPKNAGKASPYEEQLNREKEFTQNVVKALNDVTADPQKYFSAIERNAKVQADLARLGEQAALDGDANAVISSRDESLIEHMITLLDAGKFDIFEDQIKSLKALPKADLQEAFGEDPTAEGNPVADRMDTVLNRMNQIRTVYDRYQNMENPYQLRQDPMGYMAFEQGKHIMIRNDVTYARMGERMTDLFDSFVNTLPFEGANLNDFSVLFSVGTTLQRVAEAAEQTGRPSYLAASGMANEVDILTREIENLRGLGTPEETKRADALTKKRDSLNSLNRLIQAYTSIYKVTQSANQTAEDYQKNLETFEETKDILKKAYISHLQLLAEENGKIALVPQLEASFEKYADYWKLATDKTMVANAINMLNEPNNFRNSIERLKAAMTEAERQRGANLEKALATFKEKYLVNAFFNELFSQHNVFVSPEDAEAFIDSNVVPTEFIDADTMEPVPTDSPKYKEILSLVDKYDEIFYEQSGKRLKRTVLEGEGVARLAGYNTETGEMVEQFFGEKDPADKRTVKQLATEFGFSSTEPLAVDAKKVLNAIIKSEYASKEQKKLAQALLTLLRPGLMINFKTNHHTNSTYDPVNGVVVDARYSAEGFDIGTVPIEFSILNALMQEVVSDSLSDMEFNNKVTALREQLLEELSETDKLYFAYALQKNQQFVGDVMTNFDLQQAMTKIDYAGDFTEQKPEARTLWQTFIDAVLDRLAKIFPGRSKTLYQEAVNVITNKLVQPPAANATVTEEVIEEDEEIPSVPTDPELEARLRQKFDEVIASLPEAERNLIGYESWKMSDSSAMQIINEYKAEQIKKKAGEKELGKGVALTEAERKRRITELGYTVSEMNNMTPDQVNDIIQNSSKKRIKIQVPEKGKLVEKEIDFDYLMKFDDYIEEVVSDLRSTLNEKTFETYGKDSYIELDALGQPIPGTERKRVSNIVKEKFDGSKEATDRGNIIDNLLRDFIANEITDIAVFRERYNSYKAKYRESGAFSDEMLNDLFDKFRTVNILLKEKGLKAISNIPTLWGTLGTDLAAGTIDLLAYDRTGKIYIIDLKTSSQDRRLQYKIEEALEKELGKDYAAAKQLIKLSDKNLKLAIDRASGDIKDKLISVRNRPEFQALINDKGAMPVYFYKEQDALQQNAYKELLRQRTGIDVDAILIFPIKTQKTGKIYTKADFQKEANNHTMSVKTYDIHKELGLENVVGSYPENPLSAENKYQYLGIGKGPASAQIDWNAVIDRATSPQEVDKIMDQIYEANASTPELIDKALVKKQSFSPAPVSEIEKRRQDAIDQATTQNSHWSTPLITTDKYVSEFNKTPTKITWWSKQDMIDDINSGKYDAELAASQPEAPVSDRKAEIERERQEAKNSIDLRSKLEQALLRDKEEIDRTGKVDNRASSALRQLIKNKEDKIDKEYDNIILKEFGEIEYKKTKILRDKKNLEEYFSKNPTEDYLELENRKKRLAKYDEEIAALEGAKPAETGTQTQLEFEELTLNVGDRVKINTPKDGEGIIKEDRGDKVLLEDGRQVSKKNLIKLDAPEVEVVETDVAEKYRGKIIYTTPTEESISMLKDFKGVVYGPALYIRAVIGQFDDDLIEELRKISDTSYNADQWVKERAAEIVQIYNQPEKTTNDLFKLQGAINAIVKATPDTLDNPAIKNALSKRTKNAWDSTMQLAQAEAAKGYTVVFDQNEAAGRPEVDMLLLDNKSSKVLKKDGSLNKSYETAIGKANKSKVSTITGKGLINVLGGKINEAYNIPQDVANLMETLSKPTPRKVKELIVNMETLSKLGLLESLLASQNITMDGARTLVGKAKASMKGRLDITDSVLQVTGTDPIVVEYEIEDGKRLTGIIKSNNGIELEIVPFQPNMSMEDLFKQTEITKFSSDAVPTNVFPVSTQKSVTVDPEVKTQSDSVNKQSSDSFANNSEALKQAMASNDQSAADYGKNFLDEINCNQ